VSKFAQLVEILFLLQTRYTMGHQIFLAVSPSDLVDQLAYLLGGFQFFASVSKEQRIGMGAFEPRFVPR
jgi:hypothetical protein